jgi:hypothetical protein
MKLFAAKNLAQRGRALLGNGLSIALAASMVLSPLPALASAPADAAAEEPAEAAAEVGGTVALLRFDGDATTGAELRESLQYALAGEGYTVKGIKRSGEEAAKKNKCSLGDDGCYEKIGKYLNKNAKTPFDFFVVGAGASSDGGQGSIVIYDIKNNKVVKDIKYTGTLDDIILIYTLPPSVGKAMREYQVPAGEMTDEEKKVIAQLDEPEKTAEELKAEQEALEKAAEAGTASYNAGLDAGEQEVDLKRDFETYCRNGPREDKVEKDLQGEETVTRDMRPVCKRGAFFGYWQGKAYATLTLTGLFAVGTGVMYGMALKAKGEWRDAKDALDASGLDSSHPDSLGGTQYQELASDVTDAGFRVRRNALIGDALLGTTVVFGGLLGIIIWQERQAAKTFIKEQKELKAIGDLQIAPVVSRDTVGLTGGFRF